MKQITLNQTYLAMAFIGVISLVSAQDMPNNKGDRMGDHNMRNNMGMGMNCEQGLNLTNEQRLKMIELRKSFFEGNQGKREVRRDAMQKLINADQFDEAAAAKLMDEREAERKQMRMNQLKFKFEMNKILTPEQRKLQEEYQKNGYGNMNRHMKKGYNNRGNHMNGGHMRMMGQGYMHQDN